MAHDQPVKALVITLGDDPASAVYSINRLKPDALCFVLPEAGKALVESAVQPKIDQMPRRWDWIVVETPGEFTGCLQTLARSLPDLLRTWEVQPGELVVDLTGATPAVAAALTAAALPWSSRIVWLVPAREGSEDEIITLDGRPLVWHQSNPWDEVAAVSRREGSELFNRGDYAAAAKLFRDVEARVSGGQKPLYRAFADVADGYGFWERFQYRQAWDKLKTATKALEMASLWGGPAGLKSLLPAVKANAGFLERLVLDPAEAKELLAMDLLAHAGRRLHVTRDPETAMVVPSGRSTSSMRRCSSRCSSPSCGAAGHGVDLEPTEVVDADGAQQQGDDQHDRADGQPADETARYAARRADRARRQPERGLARAPTADPGEQRRGTAPGGLVTPQRRPCPGSGDWRRALGLPDCRPGAACTADRRWHRLCRHQRRLGARDQRC